MAGDIPPQALVLLRRPLPERLRYLASRLTDGTDPQIVALTLEAVAAELAQDGQGAERAFLEASIAVWREIDRLDAEPGGYHPTHMSVDLRKRERATWERYRDSMKGAPR